ncbi:hypothetical protein EBZ38_07620 [bacterium]|jgi:hypothetical protein|nr:hypothetical protein [bacterium]
MKAILEFNLPEEQSEYELYANAGNLNSALFEFANHLRSKIKYENLSDVEYRIYDEIRKEFYSILEQNEVNL